MKPVVVSIVSKKNSGKTTLLEKLIPALRLKGYRVGTVKHDIHGFNIDHQGKDTWRHKEAGAETVVISSPWKLSIIKDVQEEVGLDRIVEEHFSDMDLVITEGFMKAGKPQIEIYRSAAHSAPLHEAGATGSLMALASDTPLDLGVPCFDLDDVQGLAEFIERTLLKYS